MNIIWIVADSFRRDHIGAYDNAFIHTPALDVLAARSVRFDGHYVASFPTVPARADHHTGRFTMSFMGWEPLPDDAVTLAQILSEAGFTTAAAVDTPFYVREGMNYDRGFQGFFMNPSQDASVTSFKRGHESWDLRDAWRYESDRAAPTTFTWAMRWLERHYREDFFLYIDTWDPHEPWDAPAWYTERYWPGYDGEVIDPPYAYWQDVPGLSEEKVRKAHATYCGEVTMVDTWIGHLLRHVDNMGLADRTSIMFTTDHGFLFGEHGGVFGKALLSRRSDGSLASFRDEDTGWTHGPLYEEIMRIPLMIHLPDNPPAVYPHLSSAVDLMPTVLDILGQEIPDFVEGESLLPKVRDISLPGREFVVSGEPFINPGDSVRHVDNFLRQYRVHPTTTISTKGWSLLYAVEAGASKLYNLDTDPGQECNVIREHEEIARELHQYLVRFMHDTKVMPRLVNPRLEIHV